MDPFIGQITMFGGNFAPRGWANCDGTLLPISQNTALFSLLGTIYGGDGRTTFALPDLRGRIAMHSGSGPGLSTVPQGQKSGNETRVLTVNNLPSHTHTMASALHLRASAEDNNSDDPSGGVLASGPNIYRSGSAPDTDMAAATVAGTITAGNTGGSQAVNIRNPYLGIRFIIALQGTYPSRS